MTGDGAETVLVTGATGFLGKRVVRRLAEITEQVRVNILRATAHVVLLKATNSFTNSGFEFSLCSHGETHHNKCP